MKEERMQILRMVQEGLISVEEGTQLLSALQARPGESPAREQATRRSSSARWLRIRVVDRATERVRVNLSLPVNLLEWGLRIAERSGGVNLSLLREMVSSGAEGKILEVDESDSGERVEIFVE